MRAGAKSASPRVWRGSAWQKALESLYCAGMVKIIVPDKIRENDELVALPKREYERLKKLDWELQDAKGKVARGMKEWREGKTVVAESVEEALKKANRASS